MALNFAASIGKKAKEDLPITNVQVSSGSGTNERSNDGRAWRRALPPPPPPPAPPLSVAHRRLRGLGSAADRRVSFFFFWHSFDTGGGSRCCADREALQGA